MDDKSIPFSKTIIINVAQQSTSISNFNKKLSSDEVIAKTTVKLFPGHDLWNNTN